MSNMSKTFKLWLENRRALEYSMTEEDLIDGFMKSHYVKEWVEGQTNRPLYALFRLYVSGDHEEGGLDSVMEPEDFNYFDGEIYPDGLRKRGYKLDIGE